MSRYLEAAKAEIAKLDDREGKYKGDCRDCAFNAKSTLLSDHFDTCVNPVVQVVAFNQTDAYNKEMIQRCSEQRDKHSWYGSVVCGPDGELFQPRQKGFLERLFG